MWFWPVYSSCRLCYLKHVLSCHLVAALIPIGAKKPPNYFCDNSVKPQSVLLSFDIHILYVYVTFFIKWKTENQLEINLVHLLADENKYIDDSLVVVSSQKR